MAGSEFNLRVAWGLVEEVRENYESVFAEVRATMEAKDRDIELSGFWVGLWKAVKSWFSARKEGQKIGDLHADLDRAISICDKLDGGVVIAHPEEADIKINAATVKSTALFYKGMVLKQQGDTTNALEMMGQSLRVEPDQATLFNIGAFYLDLREQRGSGLGRVAGAAVRAVSSGADQTDAAIDAFRQCVEMNSESVVAMKAGMELSRLEQL